MLRRLSQTVPISAHPSAVSRHSPEPSYLSLVRRPCSPNCSVHGLFCRCGCITQAVNFFGAEMVQASARQARQRIPLAEHALYCIRPTKQATTPQMIRRRTRLPPIVEASVFIAVFTIRPSHSRTMFNRHTGSAGSAAPEAEQMAVYVASASMVVSIIYPGTLL